MCRAMMKRPPFGRILAAMSRGGRVTMLGNYQKRRYSPFRMLIGTILSARSRDERTDIVVRKLFARYPTPGSLANAPRADVADLIHDIGFYNQKSKFVIATARAILGRFGGRVPDRLEDLITLPGVGRKVANCVLVYAFGKEAIPVDTHVHRISNRLGWVRTKSPEETERRLIDVVPRRHWLILNDTLVSYGKTVCRPIGPRCSTCRVRNLCLQIGVTKRA